MIGGMLRAHMLPKEHAGIRCRRPFCDFHCVRSEAAKLGDLGGDVDVDDETVSAPVAGMQA